MEDLPVSSVLWCSAPWETPIFLRAVLDSAPLIATGNDSSVYLINDKAVKLYKKLDRRVLDKYLLNLSLANKFIRNYKCPRLIMIFSTPFEVNFDAIDIETSDTLDGVTFTISKYSPYPNLDVLSAPRLVFEKYRQRFLDVLEPQSIDFLSNLNLYFLEERPTRLFDEFVFAVDELSRRIDFFLGQRGHYIGKYNAKVIPDLALRRITLQITDTAVYIDRVEF
jgi:hypothetical protein